MVILLKRLSEYIKITINLESRTWRRECLLNWEYITKMMRFKNTRQKEACNIPRQKLLGYAIFKDGLEFHGFFHGIVLFHLSSSTVVRLAQLRRQNSSGRKRKVATCKAWISMSRKKKSPWFGSHFWCLTNLTNFQSFQRFPMFDSFVLFFLCKAGG